MMSLKKVVINVGLGSLFGYGRLFGVHNPLGSDIGKARDPFINLRTLARLSQSNDPQIRSAVVNNLAQRFFQETTPFSLKSPSVENEISFILRAFSKPLIVAALSLGRWDMALAGPKQVRNFIAGADEKELSDPLFRRMLANLSVYREEISEFAYGLLEKNISEDELGAITRITLNNGVLERIVDDNRTSSVILKIIQGKNVSERLLEKISRHKNIDENVGVEVARRISSKPLLEYIVQNVIKSREALLSLAMHGGSYTVGNIAFDHIKGDLTVEELERLSESSSRLVLSAVMTHEKSTLRAVARSISGQVFKSKWVVDEPAEGYYLYPNSYYNKEFVETSPEVGHNEYYASEIDGGVKLLKLASSGDLKRQSAILSELRVVNSELAEGIEKSITS